MSAEARARIDLHDLQGELRDVLDTIEDRLEAYEKATARAAAAEHVWKAHAARVTVRIADSGERTSEDVRKATAILENNDAHATYLLTKSEADICHQGIISARAHLDAIRTLISSEKSLLS